MKAGKDMTRDEKIDLISKYKILGDPKLMTDNELSGAVNMITFAKMMAGRVRK